MRGARGIEFGVDLPAIPAIGLGVSTAGHRSPSSNKGSLDRARVPGTWNIEPGQKRQPVQQARLTSQERERERERQRAIDDVVVKSSTDRWSAVLNWLTDQVPSAPQLNSQSTAVEVQSRMAPSVAGMSGEEGREGNGKEKKKGELATKADLERFYVALSRKLYNEGL